LKCANQSPDIEEMLILAAMQRSMEDELGSIDQSEAILSQKYNSFREKSRAGKFDGHFRDLNHVITNSRPQNQKKGPCVLLNTDEDSGSDSTESQLERARLIKTSRSKSQEKFFSWKKQRQNTSGNDNVMIISPKNKTRKKQIQSDSDDDDMAGT